MSRSLCLALCAFALTLSACDSTEEPALADNSFVLSIQGDGVVNGSANRSQAYSGSFVNDGESQSFAILLGADPATEDVTSTIQPFLAFVRQGARPAVGSYVLPSLGSFEDEPDGESFVGLYVDPSQFVMPDEGSESFDIDGFYFTTGGTLTISESSATRLVGSFAGTARQFSFMTGQFRGTPIQFEGRFSAVPSSGFSEGGLISGPGSFAEPILF